MSLRQPAQRASFNPTDRTGCTTGDLGVCWHIMKRTTVKIPEDLDAKLRFEAKKYGKTISEITREALEMRLGTRKRVFYGAGMGRGEPIEDVDAYLRKHWPNDLMKEFTREP